MKNKHRFNPKKKELNNYRCDICDKNPANCCYGAVSYCDECWAKETIKNGE